MNQTHFKHHPRTSEWILARWTETPSSPPAQGNNVRSARSWLPRQGSAVDWVWGPFEVLGEDWVAIISWSRRTRLPLRHCHPPTCVSGRGQEL